MLSETAIGEIESRTGRRVADVTDISGGDELATHQKVTLSDGKAYLYKRIPLSDKTLETYQKMQNLKIPAFQHTDYVWREDGIWHGLLAEWADGKTLDRELSLQDAERAAKALRTIHREYQTYQAKEDINLSETWLERFFAANTQITGEHGTLLKEYALSKLPLLQNRPATVTHGDLHMGNILVSGEKVRFIDLDECAYDDAYSDLIYMANIHRTKEEAPASFVFLNSYFDGKIPEGFWPVVNVYSIRKAILIRKFQIEHGKDPREILPLRYLVEEHDGMREDVPNWFKKMQEKS